jgi:uncharacterized protein
MSTCYLTPKARTVTFGDDGFGTVAAEPIAAGEVIASFGGRCCTRAELAELPADRQSRSIQVEEELFLVVGPERQPADLINHSCTPNCGMSGATILLAMRDIAVGEAITYDYAMSDGSDYDEFECRCGAANCRGKVTGDDWMLPEVQLAYRGYFSPYLARRISRLVVADVGRRAFAY